MFGWRKQITDARTQQRCPGAVFIVGEAQIQQTRYNDDVYYNDLKVVDDAIMFSFAPTCERSRAVHL